MTAPKGTIPKGARLSAESNFWFEQKTLAELERLPPFEGWWSPSPLKDCEAFDRLLDRLMKDFEITDRATLKSYIEVAARIYHHDPDELSKRDLKWLLKFAPKMMGALYKNALAIENIITGFDQQHVHGFEPEFCKTAYDQSEAEVFMTQFWQAAHTLKQLARILRQHRAGRRPPDRGLHGAVKFLRAYWEHELGRKWTTTFKSKAPRRRQRLLPYAGAIVRHRKVQADPALQSDRFLKTVFKVIDSAAICKLPSAVKHRVRGLQTKLHPK
jgi:hypothetical protein